MQKSVFWVSLAHLTLINLKLLFLQPNILQSMLRITVHSLKKSKEKSINEKDSEINAKGQCNLKWSWFFL